MNSPGVLSQTLHSITTTKLAQLSEQRAAFETGKMKLLTETAAATSQAQKSLLLLDGYKALLSMGTAAEDSRLYHQHVKAFLEQSKCDPSVSNALHREWQGKIQRDLDIQSLRYGYASLYGRLVMEWLSNPNDATETPGDGNVFGKSGRKEMHEQRAEWEAYVFTTVPTDTGAIENYLEKLFYSSKQSRAALETLRKDVAAFQKVMDVSGQFNETVLQHAIKGLLQSDSVTAEKRAVLVDFQSNNDVLSEVADVLNMRLASLDTWAWDPAGHPAEPRRQLNGRYRMYYDEDLLQALFLRFIGVKWSVKFKVLLTAFCRAQETWKQPSKHISRIERMVVGYFPREEPASNLCQERQKAFRNEYFLSQML